MQQTALDGGEAILQACRDLGIDYLVSSPGSDWGSIWEALARQKVDAAPGPTYLNCWHELLAVDLALGYTAMTGRMQAVLLHAGVGLMQGSMGMYGARVSEIPMLVMSGESVTFGDAPGFDPGPQWYHNHNIAGGLQTIVQPLVKWAHRAGSGANLYEMVVRAGELASANPAGPTYLGIPLEVMLETWIRPASAHAVARVAQSRPAQSDVESVARLLSAAKNPLIVTASAGQSREGYEALVELAELLGVPVVESPAADVTSFPPEHPLHQGFDGNALLRDADLVLVVRARAPWYPPKQGPRGGKIVVIDESPFKTHMAYQNLRADVVLAGHVPSTLRLLSEAARAAGGTSGADARKLRLAATHDLLQQRYRSAVAEARARPGIHPVALAATLGETLPADTIYVDETTVHLGLNRRHVAYRGAQSYLAMRIGLGQGLGVALGVKLARRDRPVVALIGDGAFLYNPTIPCLGFAREAGLPILIIIYNNRGYRAMRDSQLAFYPDGVGARDKDFYGETINGFDYEALVEPFGGFGIRVDAKEALQPALRRGYAAVMEGRTAIVNVVLTD